MATKKATSTPAKKSTKPASADQIATKSAATKAPAKAAAKKTEHSAATPAAAKKAATHDEIAKHAHKLWQQGGHHHGSHVENWLRAEKELNG